MPFAAALSEHPLATHATGEVVGHVLERLGGRRPDVALLFVTDAHGGALEDIGATVRTALDPGVLLGVTAVSVAGGPREVEERPAVSLWVGCFGPTERPPRPVRLQGVDAVGASDAAFSGLPDDLDPEHELLVVLADPFSFPTPAFLDEVDRRRPGLAVAGGLASAGRGPGGNRLLLDGALVDDGAVGVLLPAGRATSIVVSQGCRPVGDPYVVTRAEANVVHELGGQSALARLEQVVADLGPDERSMAQRGGLHIGRVIDERRAHFGPGDFLIRAVLGADRDSGAVAIGDEAEVGATLQFQVRDAASADEDLRELLAGRRADGALLFTCNGRGVGLFGEPDHDAAVLDAVVGGGATAGMFCAGELGPVGGRNFLHGYTASMILFTDPLG
ncbi:MAG: FIST C-terminal domain-containing protein [Acidimicrobiales bacterium]|nr:FIST C-terminal domain-containing protein [Acidimicrobiales bacterium]